MCTAREKREIVAGSIRIAQQLGKIEGVLLPERSRAEAAERDRLVANVTLASVSKALELTEDALARKTAECEALTGACGEMLKLLSSWQRRVRFHNPIVADEMTQIREGFRAALAPSEEVT